jgi:hypothetical protein
MWKNMVEPDRPQMTMGIIHGMRFARWLTKATNTLSEYVILVAFPLQKLLFKRTSLLHYTYTSYFVLDPRSDSKLV